MHFHLSLLIFFLLPIFENKIIANNLCDSLELTQTLLILEDLKFNRQYEAANQIYEDLNNCFRAKGQLKKAIENQINQAANWHNANKIEIAKKLLKGIILEIENQKNPQLDTLLALVYHKQGVSFYYEDNFASAIFWFKKAIDKRKEFWKDNHPEIIKGYHNVGDCYHLYGNLNSAKIFLRKSLFLHNSMDYIDTALIAKTYKVLGANYLIQGDIEVAEEYLLTALNFYKILYKTRPWDLAPLFDEFVLLYNKKKTPSKMIEFANEGLIVYSSFSEKYDNDYWGMANGNSNLGTAWEIIGDLNKALHYYKISLKINQKYPKQRREQIADTHNNLSFIYRKKGNYQLAIAQIEKALQTYKDPEDLNKIAASLHNQSEIYLEMNMMEAALAYQQKAIEKLVFDFKPKDDYENPPIQNAIISDRLNFSKHLHGKARILKKMAEQNDFQKNALTALATYDSLFLFADQQRWTFQADGSKSSLVAALLPAFEEALELAQTFYEKTQNSIWQERIFELMERSKSLVLFEALLKSQAKLTAQIPDNLRERERLLRKTIAEIEAAIFVGEEEAIKGLRNDLIIEKQALRNLSDSLKVFAPNLEKNLQPTDFLDIPKIKHELLADGKTALIEYFVGKRNIYAAVLTSEELETFVLPNNFDLENLVQTLQRHFYSEDLLNNISNEKYMASADSLIQISNLIYTKIFQPIENQLVLPEKLLLIPHGMLSHIPFDALVRSPKTDNTRFKSHDYLIQDFEIHYAHSANWLLQIKNRKIGEAEKDFLGFAPIFLGEVADKTRNGFAPLIYNIEEVEAIQNLFGGDIFIGNAATKSNFLESASQYKIIHLSTHGKANNESGDFSFLVFTNLSDSQNDYLLYARELYEMNLNADLVVLSACEAGIGELQKGEGLISLSRGFAYAGAKSMISTLWSVNDQKTAQLMQSFYAYLKDGKSKSEALRQVKLDYLQKMPHDEAHPFYWAGFVLIGEAEALEMGFGAWWILGLVGLGLLVLIFVRFAKKGRKR